MTHKHLNRIMTIHQDAIDRAVAKYIRQVDDDQLWCMDEDSLQAVGMEALWRAAKRLKPGIKDKTFGAYAYTACCNAMLNELRKWNAASRNPHEGHISDLSQADEETIIDRRDLRSD